MAWYDEDSWLTAAFAPKPATIFFTVAFAILLPILVHYFMYRKAAAAATLPTFLLAGPMEGGKTTFLTLAARGSVLPARTSIEPSTVEALLPDGFVPASAHYRSAGDPAFERARRFLLHDTPGHGKLRHYATTQLGGSAGAAAPAGILFVVDAASLAEDAALNEAAEYLHDVLLALQKRYTSAKTSKGPSAIPVLVAANKLDLFTALPAHLVQIKLEKAITDVRKSRAKALKDSGGSALGGGGGEHEALDDDDEREWLGEGGEGPFEFRQMEEAGITVEVSGGNLLGGDGPDVKSWWEWVADKL